MKLTLEGELAEKKLSPEFLKWLDEQFVACGENWAAFGEKVGIKKGTIFQWKENIVGELKDESLEKLMRYMAQLPPGQRIIAASIDEVKIFVQHGIRPGADMNNAQNVTLNTILNRVAMGTPQEAVIIGKACFEVIEAKTQGPSAGSERIREFILRKLQQSGRSEIGAKDFAGEFYPSPEGLARLDRWMRGLEAIPKTALYVLAAALSAKTSQSISQSDLLAIYAGNLVEVDD
jgi:hypothetical protein